MKLSEAFKLLEDGKVLGRERGCYVFMDLNGKLIKRNNASGGDIVGITVSDNNYFKNFRVYETPKEKVQMYIALVKSTVNLPSGSREVIYPYVGMLFKDEQDFKSQYFNVELVQLVKFGDPI